MKKFRANDDVDLLRSLQDTEEKARLIIERAYDAFVAIDADGIITDWNQQAENTFGWRKEEIIGQNIAETIIPPRYRQQHLEGIRNFHATGRGPVLNARIEIAALHRSGREFPIELAVFPVPSAQGVTFCAFLHDIEDRKALEKQISKLNQMLETRVADLARSNEELKQLGLQLTQARDLALKASHSKSEFLANMSHEIRTPMNAIIGMSQLLLHSKLSAEQREFARVVFESASGLLDIVNDILDFSKIEAGQLKLELYDFDIVALVESVAELLAEKSQQKGLPFMTYVETAIPRTLIGDAGRLRQILLNLTHNAIKFTDRGEVTIRATVEPSAEEITVVRFTVHDTGIGMSPEVTKRIFQPFVQADSSTSRQFGGTGLGLSVCRHLVELMGGEIGVESTAGSGSTFWFTVPFESADTADTHHISIDFKNTRVLLACGTASILEIISAYLRSWNLECNPVSSGDEALSQISRSPSDKQIDLAIVEAILPDMTAAELVQKAQQGDLLKNMKVIVVNSQSPKESLKEEFSASLSTPVKQSTMFDCIASVMGKAAPQTARRKKRRSGKRSDPSKLILIVEDNPVNQKVTALQLKQLGYTAQAVTNGREAIDAISRTNYALVLMDCQMPEMDGFAASREVRKAEAGSGSHLPIVAMTAHALAGDREKCLSAGMDDYISKPVDTGKLQQILERWIAPPSKADPAKIGLPHAIPLPPKSPLLDLSALEETFQKESVHELLDLFVSSTDEILTRIHDAIVVRDYAAVKAAAHELKGSTGLIRAHKMTALCEDLELAAASEDLGLASRSHLALKRLHSRIADFIQQSF